MAVTLVFLVFSAQLHGTGMAYIKSIGGQSNLIQRFPNIEQQIQVKVSELLLNRGKPYIYSYFWDLWNHTDCLKIIARSAVKEYEPGCSSSIPPPLLVICHIKECVPVSIIFILQGVPYSRPFMYVSYISWNLSIIIACIVKDIVEDKEKTKFLSTHFTAFVR